MFHKVQDPKEYHNNTILWLVTATRCCVVIVLLCHKVLLYCHSTEVIYNMQVGNLVMRNGLCLYFIGTCILCV